MDIPLVSICVPVYGVERYIEKCCRSLFEQTYTNIEYIFVDDCSPDKSIDVLKNILDEYPNRKDTVKIISHKFNKGLSGARNSAIEAVTGEFLMHVDSDDYLDLDVVEKTLDKALNQSADVVAFDMRYVYSDKLHIVHQQIPVLKVDCVRATLTYAMSVCVCGGLYKTSLFKDNNIRFVEGLNFGEDYVVKPRILYYAEKIVHCDNCYYNYVQYNQNSYTLSYKEKNIDDLIKAISILEDFFRAKSDVVLYKKALDYSRIMSKIKLLIAVCLHKDMVGHRLPMVASLYDNIHISNISLSYHIVLYLAKFKLYKLLSLYVRIGFKIKQSLK